MTIIIPTLAVAFAAFCVWLAVRIVNRRERWAKRLAVALVLTLAYPMSFGPVCWWLSTVRQEGGVVSARFRDPPLAYWPIGYCAKHGPESLHEGIRWYATLGLRTENSVWLSASHDDSDLVQLWSKLAR